MFADSHPKSTDAAPPDVAGSVARALKLLAEEGDATFSAVTPQASVMATDLRKPICCQDYALPNGTISYDVSYPALKYGNHSCDAPPALLDATLASIEATSNFSFSIFTGDVVDADVWNNSQTSVTDDLHHFYADYPGQLLSSLGNHDTSPVNSFPRRSTTTNSSQWVYDLAATDWAETSARNQSGCYSYVPAGTNLRVISINTQLWYGGNFWLYDQTAIESDPDGILAWMTAELWKAENAGQRAWISELILRDSEFEIGYSNNDNKNAQTANLISHVQGGLTPRDSNPSYRVYDVDPDTYEIMDATEYIANMTDPHYQEGPEFKPLYSFRDSYGYMVDPPLGSNESLSPAFFHRLTEAFNESDSNFQSFYQRIHAYYFAGYNASDNATYSVAVCDESCKTGWLCSLRAMRSEDNCDTVTPGISFRKRDEIPGAGRQQTDLEGRRTRLPRARKCDGLSIRDVMEELGTRISQGDSDYLDRVVTRIKRRRRM
ncbi:hypothetical protein MNV49_007594 [Pseudohyphozyma bogoriensis]|nr:hypothetical protein MNV49_007594 [Pseudohyphozyma bogoriensis]